MLLKVKKATIGAMVALAAVAAVPASADVKRGVDAWSRGDYAAAVREWEAPAGAGDADALFNLGQAYRLGRGVPVDLVRAEDFYARAAAKGHLQAADTYGLLLFQAGRREQALPYIQDAARRGDPRAQYLLGIAYFNGDLLERDYRRAYALLTLANGAGLPQAASALAQMDEHIPLELRQSAAGLAVEMKQQSDSTRARELAAAELATGGGTPVAVQPPAERAPAAGSAMAVPRPLPTTDVAPSTAAARTAVAAAGEADGTESPATSGASYLPRGGSTPPVAPAPAAAPAPRAQAPASGPWKLQLGAFAVSGNAERLWSRLSARAELAGKQRILEPAGRVTKLLAGGFATQADAQAACRSLKSAGQECLVTR